MPELSNPIAISQETVGRPRGGRSRLGSCLGIQIAGTGSYVPSQIVTNEDLVALGCDSDWIVQRTGICERRRAAAGESTSDLAYAAAVDCLANAGVEAKDVDLVIVATMTPDYATPSTACLLQERLGCLAPAMDLNAACAGFMYALATAGNFVRGGMAKKALVVGSEVMSDTINPADIKTYPLFGDGAGAVLVVADPEPGTVQGPHFHERNGSASRSRSGLLAYTLGSEGSGANLLCIPGGGSRQPLTAESIEAGQQYLHMDGRSVFKWAVRVVNDSCRDCIEFAGLQFSDIDLVLLHQANIRIIDSAVRDFGIPDERVFVNLDRFGNTSAASIPLALDHANRQGKIQRGNHLLLCGFGAGLAWGTAVLKW
jgi:3-oxoacyl-[acyl-carrier-protein] synthase III